MRPGLALRYSTWIRTHHVGVLVTGLVLFGVGVLGASRLRIDASMRALLPSGDRAAGAVDEVERRLGGLSTLVVVLRSPNPEANQRYAAELAARVTAAADGLIERAIYDVSDVRAFVDEHRWLFVDEPILVGLRDRVRLEVQSRKNPLFVSLDEPPTLDALKARLEARHADFGDLGSTGVLGTRDGQLVALVIVPAAAANGKVVDDSTLERIVAHAIAGYPPSRVDPAITWHFAGEVHTTVAERRSMESDVLVVSVAVVILSLIHISEPTRPY